MLKRFEQLDSLRGIAALFVLFYHMGMCIPHMNAIWKLISYTPLRLFTTGEESVIFFFVLSGFVLSQSFLLKKNIEYSTFIIKRICRIYIPYAFAITIGIAACLLLSHSGIKNLSVWFNMQWTSNPDVMLILNHYLLIGNFNVYSYDVVLWSLIHEMRISIIFPFLMMIIGKYNWKTNIFIGVMLGLIGGALHLYFRDPYQSLYKTLPYVLMFITGILLAKHRQFISDKYSTLTTFNKLIFFIVGLITYNYAFLLKNQVLVNWLVTVGATIIIITALNSNRVSSILLLNPIHFLGKISYSLYLIHLVIMLFLIHSLYNMMPISLIFLITIPTTIGVSSLMYYSIEKSSIKFGKLLTDKKSILKPTQTL